MSQLMIGISSIFFVMMKRFVATFFCFRCAQCALTVETGVVNSMGVQLRGKLMGLQLELEWIDRMSRVGFRWKYPPKGPYWISKWILQVPIFKRTFDSWQVFWKHSLLRRINRYLGYTFFSLLLFCLPDFNWVKKKIRAEMVDKKSTFSQLKVHLVTFIVKVFSVDWISKRLLNISFWFGFPFKRSFVALMDASIVDLSFQLSFSYPIQLKGGGLRGIFARGRGGGG